MSETTEQQEQEQHEQEQHPVTAVPAPQPQAQPEKASAPESESESEAESEPKAVSEPEAESGSADQAAGRSAVTVPPPASAPGAPADPEHTPDPAVPPLPAEPPLSGEQASPGEPPRSAGDRRVLRAVLRWTAAVVVFAAAGAGTAYGITDMKRTDVPGLATASDGRWDYPELVKPPLPDGRPGAYDAESEVVDRHYADLRKLVLPAPEGAKPDGALRGTDGWLPTEDFLSQYASKDDRDELGQTLTDQGLRHIAARGWTTPDGTRTRVYLLQFATAAVVDDVMGAEFAQYDAPMRTLRGSEASSRDESFPEKSDLDTETRFTYAEDKPYGAEQTRQAYIGAGDTLALVVQSRKGGAAAVPFQQTVVLQGQLLD